VVEAHARDVHLFDQLEDAGDFLNIEAVDGEAQAHLDTRRLAVADAVQRSAEGARHRAEAVVDGFHPVDADADVGQADLLQGVRHLGGDQSTVGGDHGAHALGHGVGGQVGQVLAHEGLSA